MGRPIIDLTGQTINGIYVKERFGGVGRAGVHAKWLCTCSVCGRDFVVASQHLRDKKNPITKCADCAHHEYEDLTGQKFGMLTVIKHIGVTKYPWGDHEWLCQCECGNTTIAGIRHLRDGKICSCGCLLSKAERDIAIYLTEHNIEYERQKTFPDLAAVYKLRYDFYLPKYNTIIEYNGEQHYRPVEFFGGEEKFKLRQQYDEIKIKYCKDNDINIIIIPYWQPIDEALSVLLSEDIV